MSPYAVPLRSFGASCVQQYLDPNFRADLPHLIIGDPAFVSTTLDVDVATDGDDFGGICVFTVRGETPPSVAPSFQGNGANVEWVSQYPCETERLLPSNTLFIPDPFRKGQAEYERDPRFHGRKVCYQHPRRDLIAVRLQMHCLCLIISLVCMP